MDVTEQDYELLSRYLDRELPTADADRLQQRLATEPALQQRLAELQSLQGQLQNAFHTAAAGPVPPHITALLQTRPANVVALPRRRVANWGFALAASLVVAVAATQLTLQKPQPGVDTLLSAALDTSPSRGSGWEALPDGRSFRPVLSFRSTAGTWCREYLLTDGSASWHGVACREGDVWHTSVIADTALPGSGSEYRPAGANDADQIADFIDLNAADIALDARREAELITSGWQ